MVRVKEKSRVKIWAIVMIMMMDGMDVRMYGDISNGCMYE